MTSTARRIGREERVARPGGEDHDPALLQVANRAAADVRLGDLVHGDRGHDPCRHAGPFEGVLQRQAVHDRREHAHVVARRAVHALRGGGQAAEDVPAAHHDADLDPEPVDLGHLPRDERTEGGVDAVGPIAE